MSPIAPQPARTDAGGGAEAPEAGSARAADPEVKEASGAPEASEAPGRALPSFAADDRTLRPGPSQNADSEPPEEPEPRSGSLVDIADEETAAPPAILRTEEASKSEPPAAAPGQSSDIADEDTAAPEDLSQLASALAKSEEASEMVHEAVTIEGPSPLQATEMLSTPTVAPEEELELLSPAASPRAAKPRAPSPSISAQKLAHLANNHEPTQPTSLPPSAPPPPSHVGPYSVLSVAGEGAMAVVYKAIQPNLERVVAIKSLRSRYVEDPQIATRFAREAASLATLQHGSIVHVYDYFVDETGAHIVMEFVDGIDLYNVLNHTRSLPTEVALTIGLAIAEGLEHAHHQGIVHRDIKPSNILLSKKGDVKLMDFGIARDHHQDSLTQTGLAVGTPSYMAPEQIRGDPIDFRTDLFALAVVLYELLSGEKPWPEIEGRAVTVRVLDDPPVPLSEVAPHLPPGLVRLIHRCLQKRPQHRYRSTHEFCRELAHFATSAIDPRARIALFLFNRKLIGSEDITGVVPLTLRQDLALRRADLGEIPPSPKPFLNRMLSIYAGALGLILITLLASWGLLRPPARASLEIARVPAALAEDEPGGLLVVIDGGWARVEVDGEDRATTPFAAPIELPAGRHHLRLHNNETERVEEIVIVPGQTTWVQRRMPEP